MGTSANTVGIGREEDGFEYFQTRVAKTSHVKFVDGSPSDKYMEEIGGNYKNHGRKPSPPKGLMRRSPHIPETWGCNCPERVISV